MQLKFLKGFTKAYNYAAIEKCYLQESLSVKSKNQLS